MGAGWGYVVEGVRLQLKCGWDDWLCFSEAALCKYHERGCELALEAQLPLLNNQLCKAGPCSRVAHVVSYSASVCV